MSFMSASFSNVSSIHFDIKGKGAMEVWQVRGDLLKPEKSGVGQDQKAKSSESSF
jgi:hypothetical protein